MVRKDANSGFAPYPSFLTETLRSQSRFHDPHADSIFSWSDSVDRYRAWSEAYTRPASGTASPSSKPRSDPVSSEQLRHAINERAKDPAPLDHIYADSSAGINRATIAVAAAEASGAAPSGGAPPFGHAVPVRSSAPEGTSTHHALSSRLSSDGSHLELQLPTLVTPRMANGKRVRYAVLEYDPLLDSSEMDIPDWIRLARDISLNYQHFDAFIVLHGTDTMAYTASALSMLLENLGKSVIVTGAQVPLSELRNDAIENVLGALTLAGSYIIPEVGLYFASSLYRGNRTSKVSNNALAAFDSPNMAPIARVGIHIDVAWNLVERPRALEPFRAHGRMSPNVALLRLFPGLPTSTVYSFLSPPLQGVVLESYGAGNAPSRQDLLDVFRQATERGMVIVNITQCMQGEVSAIYAVGKKLEAVGVVAGGDMTPECALAKLSYLLGKPELSPAQVRELMGRPLRGELTPSRSPRDPVPAAAADVRSLLAHILRKPTRSAEPSDQELSDAAATVLPYLIREAARSDDAELLRWHLSAATSNSNSLESLGALHAAAARGSSSAVQVLLEAGCSVHARDEVSGHSPLFIAARNGHTHVAALLREAGAHLKDDEVALASVLREQCVNDEAWRLALGSDAE